MGEEVWSVEADAKSSLAGIKYWQGEWTTSVAYILGDGVHETTAGSSYICILAHTAAADNKPGSGVDWTTYWDLLASKGDSGTTDTDAIHDNVAAEISAITEKASPVSGDWILIEDSADGNNKKKVQAGNLPTGATDNDAIHDNVAAEISVITEKVTPVSGDFLVIEDSAAGNVKKRVQVGNLPTAAGSGDVNGPASATDNAIVRFDATTGKLIQDSSVLIDDTDNLSGVETVSFNSITSPAHSEGKVFYDSVKKALSYYNDEVDVTVNLGQEVLVRVRNETGATIPNGSVVYPLGVSAGMVTIGLADASVNEKSRLVGMVTHDIENNSNGYVTRFGEVSDLDTSAFSAGGVLYLSATTPGAVTDVKPDDGGYVVTIGAVKLVNATTGSIIVAPQVSELTVEVTDTNGFPSAQKTGTTLSFVDGTRTFTITPTGSGFHYYMLGDKYEKTSAQSVVITNVEGLHAIYFDGSTLTAIANPTEAQEKDLIINKCFVSYIYWDATNSVGTYFADERHGISMSPETHEYLHHTRGTQYSSGLGLADFVTEADGSLDSHAQFSIAAGVIVDEDIENSSSAIASTVGMPIYYLDGASANMRRIVETGFSVLTDTTAGSGATGRLVWNEFTGGAWQLTTATNNDFILCHIFAINGYAGEDQQIAIIGQAEYATVAQARTGAESEISSIMTQFPFEEIVIIGTVIFQTSDSYSNSVKARVRDTDSGDEYVDWRTTELVAGAAPSDHENLSGLLGGAAADHYHMTAAQHTIATQAASDTQAGYLTELATAAETTTGTDATRAVTPDGLAGSDYGKGKVSIQVTDGSGAITTGDGKAYIRIPEEFNGHNLVGVDFAVTAPSTSGALTFTVERGRQASPTTAHAYVDMLSTASTIDVNEYDTEDAGTPAVINTSNDDVVTGDLVRINFDGIGSGPSAVVIAQLIFQLP